MASARKEFDDGQQPSRGASGKGRFVDWEIVSDLRTETHTLTHFGAATIRVRLNAKQQMRAATYGVGLYDHERRLVWAWNSPKLRLDVGECQFLHTFPMLPLRPGSYGWLVTLYDDSENVDWWHCEPEMIVATQGHQSHLDEWTGVLNMPVQFEVIPTQTLSQDGDSAKPRSPGKH